MLVSFKISSGGSLPLLDIITGTSCFFRVPALINCRYCEPILACSSIGQRYFDFTKAPTGPTSPGSYSTASIMRSDTLRVFLILSMVLKTNLSNKDVTRLTAFFLVVNGTVEIIGRASST